MARLGAGMDVVSEGELRRALAAGVPADKIIFAGVGKTREEMAYALEDGILGFNVESEPELEALSEVAVALGRNARASPSASTRTSTPRRTPRSRPASRRTSSAFPISQAPRALCRARAGCPASRRRHPHAHRQPDHGSRAVPRRVPAHARPRRSTCAARATTSEHLDIGGGLGVPYRGANDVPPHPDEYAGARQGGARRSRSSRLVLEPGRMIVGNAGILVTRVIYIEAGRRPRLHDRRRGHERSHPADALRGPSRDLAGRGGQGARCRRSCRTSSGPVCETGDYLALGRGRCRRSRPATSWRS